MGEAMYGQDYSHPYPSPPPPPPGYGYPPPGYGYPPPGYGYPPPGYHIPDSPTVSGLFYMLIAGILILVGALVCGVISFIGYILAIIGFYKIYTDRNSYDEPHPSNMKLSLVLYILGIILVIVGAILIVIATFSLVFSMIEGNLTSAFNSFLLYIVIGALIATIGEILWVFGRYKLLVKLMPVDRIGFLQAAVVIVIIVSIIGLIVVPILFSGLQGAFKGLDVEDEESTEELQRNINKFSEKTSGISWLNAGLGIISQILFILCFYFAYDYQKKNPQLRKGGTPYPSPLSHTTPPPGYPPPGYSPPPGYGSPPPPGY